MSNLPKTTNRTTQGLRDMLNVPEIPRLKSGRIALCHLCQRCVYFANGFLNLIVRALKRQARHAISARRARTGA